MTKKTPTPQSQPTKVKRKYTKPKTSKPWHCQDLRKLAVFCCFNGLSLKKIRQRAAAQPRADDAEAKLFWRTLSEYLRPSHRTQKALQKVTIQKPIKPLQMVLKPDFGQQILTESGVAPPLSIRSPIASEETHVEVCLNRRFPDYFIDPTLNQPLRTNLSQQEIGTIFVEEAVASLQTAEDLMNLQLRVHTILESTNVNISMLENLRNQLEDIVREESESLARRERLLDDANFSDLSAVRRNYRNLNH